MITGCPTSAWRAARSVQHDMGSLFGCRLAACNVWVEDEWRHVHRPHARARSRNNSHNERDQGRSRVWTRKDGRLLLFSPQNNEVRAVLEPKLSKLPDADKRNTFRGNRKLATGTFS